MLYFVHVFVLVVVSCFYLKVTSVFRFRSGSLGGFRFYRFVCQVVGGLVQLTGADGRGRWRLDTRVGPVGCV